MRIAFDSLVLGPKFRNTGSYVYARNVLAGFSKQLEANRVVSICGFAATKESPEATELRNLNLDVSYSWSFRCRPLWRFGGLSVAASNSGADLIFSPTAYILPTNIPVVSTIHDVIPMRVPSEMVQRSRLSNFVTSLSARRSIRIITDSMCSKRDLMDVFDLPDERIKVIYLGYDKEKYNSAPISDEQRAGVLKRWNIRSPYIVHHGMVQSRKNLRRLIEAFGLLRGERKDFDLQLVLAGPLGYQCEEIIEAARRIDPEERSVILTKELSDDDLAVVVKSAAMAVIPSLYEGFCLPLVEAMASGVPTIAANASCLPEISGDRLRYFDVSSVESMSELMKTVLDDSQLRNQLRNNGIEQTQQLSWERCATETLELLIDTCNGRSHS